MATRRRNGKSLVAVTEANSAAILQENQDQTARKAYELRLAGKSWFEIAKTLGIVESDARTIVSNQLTAAAAAVSDGAKQELLALEIERIDQLHASRWEAALRGDRVAFDQILKLAELRAKRLRLDDISDVSITNNTLVVAGTTEEYINALRATIAS